MAQTVVVQGQVTGKGLPADTEAKVHEALTKTLQAELKGRQLVPATHHASFHGSIVYE